MLRKLSCGVLLLATSGFAQRVELDGRYWITNADNRAHIQTPRLNQEVDFQRDLGMADQNFGDLRLTFHPHGRSRLTFGYTHLNWSGDQEVRRAVEFNNRLYTVGTRVLSNLEVNQVRLDWAYQFVNLGSGKFRLGPLVGAQGFWLDASLQAPELNLSASDNRAVGFPSVGLALDVNPHRQVHLYGESSGISLGRYGYFVGGEAGLEWMPVRRLGLVGGYRIFRIDPKFQPDYAHLRVRGPFVGAALQF